MSRSKHTDPRAVRAKRRLISPRAHRSEGDLSQRRQIGRTLKEAGSLSTVERDAQPQVTKWPQITVRRPNAGYFHPASRNRVQSILETVGPSAAYGLKSIELARLTETDQSKSGLLARYLAPDRIILFEQQLPPWHLVGKLASADTELVEKSGAQVIWSNDASASTVDWPGNTLGDFLLFEGLLHEIGHHILQHEARADSRRIARTKDHEAFAALFAARTRRELQTGSSSV